VDVVINLTDVDLWLHEAGYEPNMISTIRKEVYLHLIKNKRQTIKEIMAKFNRSRSTLRVHLDALISMGWVRKYTANDPNFKKNGRPETYYETTHIVDE
jgi:predicted transcriptional regulator